MQTDEDFVDRWCEVEKRTIFRKRKKRKELILIEDTDREAFDIAA
jgi:hypothetical protein